MFLKFQIGIFIFLSCFLFQVYGQVLTEYQRLISAVANWDLAEVHMSLREGVNPHARDNNDWRTPFHVMRHIEFVENAGGWDDYYGYHYDKVEDKTEPNLKMIEHLIEAGANVKARDRKGRTPLHNITIGLCITGRFRRQQDRYCLDNAAKARVSSAVKAMVRAGADPNATDNKGLPPFHSEWVFHRDSLLKTFLDVGADPNFVDKEGKTVLHKIESRETAGMLIDNGADPTIRDNNGNLAPVIRNNPDLLESYLNQKDEEKEEEEEISCQYITPSSQIQATQCGQRRICMAEVSCTFKVGTDSNKTQIDRDFQAVCSSLSDGQCPKASDCVLDRLVVEAEKAQTESRSSSAVPKSSSGDR